MTIHHCQRIMCLILMAVLVAETYDIKKRPWVGCISRYEAERLLGYCKRNAPISSPTAVLESIDLGFSVSSIILTNDGIHLSSSTLEEKNSEVPSLIATWEELRSIADRKSSGCYAVYDDGSKPWKISTISTKTNIPASLCPPLSASGAPTMVLGGFTMHRISGDQIDPMIDTSNKLDSLRISPSDRVLDTCCGLGYTAIGAAKRAKFGSVTTIEYDPASLEMCSYNPWSQQLFDKTLPIQIIEGDSCELIRSLPDEYFDIIIHDPPARALCKTDLYGLIFYKELRRCLRKGGQIFHYIGNPTSKESGRLYGGITERLKEAGFKSVRKAEAAFGLTACV